MDGDSSNPSNASLQRQAIEAALSCQWSQALECNRKLIKLDPENVDCLNRLAKAYLELGQYNQAKKTYETVLKLDAYNSIAQKNLKKVTSYKKNGFVGSANDHTLTISPALFLQEPGMTKLVTLIKVAEPHKLMTLSIGAVVEIIAKSRGITISDSSNHYLGVLPDDIAHHLLKLVKGGNKYQAIIKSVKPNSVTILVREVFRSKKFKNQPSFLDESRILAYSSDHIALMDDKPEEETDEPTESDDTNL